jgi:hypothetical protein
VSGCPVSAAEVLHCSCLRFHATFVSFSEIHFFEVTDGSLDRADGQI